MKQPKQPSRTDVYVGERIRMFRLERGVSQTDIACELGISFQQVQKYEKGTNRIAPGRLEQIAAYLEKHITAFFPGKDAQHPDADLCSRMLGVHGAHELATAFLAIEDADRRRFLVRFAQEMAGHERKIRRRAA